MLVKKYNKKILFKAASLGIFIFLGAVFLLGNGGFASAATADELAWNGQQAQFEQETGLSSTNPVIVVTRIIQIFLGFLGFIAVILIIYAGFLWMTSAGDADKVKKAKDILKNAFIGLVIILSSVGIVTFILNLLINGNGGGGGNGNGGGPGNVPPGTGAIGNCAIVDYYPTADQKDVPRNSVVMVTFREAIKFSSVFSRDTDTLINDKNDNIRLFKKEGNCNVVKGDSDDCEFVTATATTTADKKTIIIMPNEYLGSQSEKVTYYIVLNNNIKASSTNRGIFSNCTPDSAFWSFEVSTMLDLDPPQVLKREQGGVFPLPDSQADTHLLNTASKATGKITINNTNIKTLIRAGVAGITKNPVNAGWGNIDKNLTSINDGCRADRIEIGVSADLTAVLQVNNANAGVGALSDDKKSFKFDYCDLKIVLEGGKDFLAECGAGGCAWNMAITPYQEPDYLMIGGAQYIFVKSGTNFNEITLGGGALTKNGIATSIANKSYADVAMSASGNVINLTAQKAGKVGNGINISSSNPGLVILAMNGGADLNDGVEVRGTRDEPRNAIIKMNFNDQMLPINVSGAATADSSIFVQCINANNCVDANYFFDCNAGNRCVKGKFKISNQYKTVEFQSNNKCGMNSCGEDIYCLPANTELSVGLKAAALVTCNTDNDCVNKNPFNKCVNSHCQDAALNKNYPLAKDFNGLVDKARNSLDGNRDTMAIGPMAFYDENTSAGSGDNFKWSFFITDKIDLTPPKIFNNLPMGGGAPTSTPVNVSFNKIMMSSSLIPGYIMIPNLSDDGKEVKHKTFNVWAKSGFPIGYWVTSVDEYDAMQTGRTIASINHSDFDEYNNYRAQSGSGIKDIYQNCFKPSDKVSPSCVANGKPSCCNGVATGDLNVDGNCPN